MTNSPPTSLRPSVLEARERLRTGRVKLRRQHDSGSPGTHVSARLTDLVDGVVLRLYEAAVAELGLQPVAGQIALVAHGGYGRRDLAPFSDLDLMLVPLPRVEGRIAPLARRLSQDIFDAGLQLGFSVRSPRVACQWAWKDPTVFTSLAESRLLCGSVDVFSRYFHSFRLGTRRRHRRLVQAVIRARMEERVKWGDTVYLLRPNVKRSRGALRDVQLVRWVGFATSGEAAPEQLVELGLLSDEDHAVLRRARSFLLRLRNELHFLASRSQDLLDRAVQMQIAEAWGIEGGGGLLPVERFMQTYFAHTSDVRYAAAHFVDTVRHRPLLGRTADRFLARRLDEDIRLGPHHLWVRPEALPRFAGDPTAVLRLMDLSNQYRRRIDHPTWEAIRSAMRADLPRKLEASAIGKFLDLLRRPGRLADLLRRLHELRVLEQLIPPLRRARCLLQFNEYHKYTVDAHSLRAVAAAEGFEASVSLVGEVYRRLKPKWLLHLALLVHDLGKGFDEDHSEVGRRLALQTAEHLELPDDDAELLAALVHKHLRMAHVAFRHDLNDPQIVGQFAAELGSQRMLDILFVHTAADLEAVGPDVLTEWKMRLLEELYLRTREFFRSGSLPGEDGPATIAVRESTRGLLIERDAPAVCFRCLQDMPASAVDGNAPDELAEQLLRLPTAESTGGFVAWGRYIEAHDAMLYTVAGPHPSGSLGIVARATGALSARGLEILRAEIHTLADAVVWDRFLVRDLDFEGEPPGERVDEVCRQLTAALAADRWSRPAFRRVWKAAGAAGDQRLAVLPQRVEFDNDTSDRFTILSLFAYDRPGLLYDITRTLADAKVVVHFAKIGTHLDQVVDVFYVTDLADRKLTDREQKAPLRDALYRAITPPAEEAV